MYSEVKIGPDDHYQGWGIEIEISIIHFALLHTLEGSIQTKLYLSYRVYTSSTTVAYTDLSEPALIESQSPDQSRLGIKGKQIVTNHNQLQLRKCLTSQIVIGNQSKLETLDPLVTGTIRVFEGCLASRSICVKRDIL